jgi:mRNA-degrading endonuclease RelE of RelBE toxin-antitoxin system
MRRPAHGARSSPSRAIRGPQARVDLTGSPFWRLRVGDLRVLYAIDDRARTIVVLRVARRNESTYRRVR